jgi:flagellar biosynthesis/type III secretory pathway chaperone
MSETSTKPAANRLIELLTSLESVLASEFQAIHGREREKLATLTDAKQILVDDINVAMRDMHNEVQALINDKNSKDGQHLLELIQNCARANKTNGCAIKSSQSFTVSLLDILKGRSPRERVYTSRGRLGMNERSPSGGFISV